MSNKGRDSIIGDRARIYFVLAAYSVFLAVLFLSGARLQRI